MPVNVLPHVPLILTWLPNGLAKLRVLRLFGSSIRTVFFLCFGHTRVPSHAHNYDKYA